MAASSHAAELQAVKDNLRDLRGQLKRLHDPATPEPGRCTRVRCPETERTATMVFLMTQENEDMAELYVQQKRRNATVQNPWPRGHFGIRCSGWTDADKAEMLAPTTPKGRAAVRAATNFVEQHGLQVWVRGQNELKALAPSTTAAADEALRVCPGGTPDAHAQRWKHRRYGRQWVRRWAAVSVLCVADSTLALGCPWKLRVPRLGEHLGGVLKTIDPRFQNRASGFQNSAPFSGPKNGPKIRAAHTFSTPTATKKRA